MSQYRIFTRAGNFTISQKQYQYVIGALADMHPMITLEKITGNGSRTVDVVFMKEAIDGVLKDESDEEG